jgi:hypothetical protein
MADCYVDYLTLTTRQKIPLVGHLFIKPEVPASDNVSIPCKENSMMDANGRAAILNASSLDRDRGDGQPRRDVQNPTIDFEIQFVIKSLLMFRPSVLFSCKIGRACLRGYCL